MRSSRYVSVAGSAPDRRISDRSCRFLLGEAAVDAARIVDAGLDARGRLHRLVHDDREMLADVLAGDAAEGRRAFTVQREPHRGLVVLIHLRPRTAQIVARHGRHPPHEVEGGRAAGTRRRIGHAAHHFHIRGNAAAGGAQQILLRGGGTLLHQLQLEHPWGADDFLRALHVGYARKLHQNLIRALLGDARLGHAQLVHATLDRLPRLHDRLFAQRLRHAGPHGEGVAAIDAGAAIEIGGFLGGRLPEHLILRRWHAIHLEVRHVHEQRGGGNAPRLHLGLQPRHLLLRLHAERIIGLHAQDQMHATLQIETELELMRGEPSGAGRL